MTSTNKILIGVGGVVVLGAGIYFITRKPQSSTTTTTTTGEGTPGQTDPSSSSVDSLGTTFGNIFSDIWAQFRKNKNPGTNNPTNTTDGCNYTGPVDPASVEISTGMSFSEIQTLQNRLIACDTDIAAVINGSGGADGIMGPGTKSAYNMARKSCCVNSPTT
tara:strand:- start:2334 stop:2819 length:486 start_codon:yes stop_codon:yes gene_type:complete